MRLGSLQFEPAGTLGEAMSDMRNQQSTNQEEPLIPRSRSRCDVCDSAGARRHRGLLVCFDCQACARPYESSDPYDVIGGPG